MSNLEAKSEELTCPSRPGGMEILEPREVPLGGPRAMTVRRTLPQKARSLIGAWCFVDHYGPDLVGPSGGMKVPPHPHTGLQTVSWLFSGAIDHADSAGFSATVLPGEVNLMTAGRGISHSEYSTESTTTLHGVQLWLALPDSSRFVEPTFEHFVPTPVHFPGAVVRVFLGELVNSSSPITSYSPTLGAEIMLDAGAELSLDISTAFEHGFLVDAGTLMIDGTRVDVNELAYLGPGHGQLTLEAVDGPVRLMLLGGTPLGESIVMWWNFVGRSHEEIQQFRAAWQNQISASPALGVEPHFGLPAHYVDAPLPAPTLPTVRLRPRSNPQ